MQKQKCFPYNTTKCDMSESFPELPQRFPPYYLCQNKKRDDMNNNIDNRNESFVRNCNKVTRGENLGYEISPSALWRVKQAPADTFNEFSTQEMLTPDFVNLGASGDKFYGYARNIDVESELFRINYLNDKCFDSKYKIDPNLPTSSLFMYRNELNNNPNDCNQCYKDYTPPNIDKVSIENKYNPVINQYLDVQNNTYRDIKLQPLKCLNGPLTPQTFSPSEDKVDQVYFMVGPGFNNNLNEHYPPQQTWNNFTKRRMIYHRQFEKPIA